MEVASLPDDVLFEIFGHLAPEDLGKLAQCNASFRRIAKSEEVRISNHIIASYSPCFNNAVFVWVTVGLESIMRPIL
jgi:hypothetical protein